MRNDAENYLIGKKKKQTVLIMYPPGGYGTFVEWAIRYLSGQINNNVLPFLPSGSAHRYRGTNFDSHRGDHVAIADYLKSDEDVAFARTHATDFNRKLDVPYTHTFTRFFRKIICLVPDESVELLLIHNLVNKLGYTPSRFFKEDEFNYYDINEAWETREAISFWLRKNREEVMLWKNLHVANDDVYYLKIRDLIDDPEKEIAKLLQELKLEQCIDSSEMFKQWKSLQKSVTADKTCQTIVDAVVYGSYYDWSHVALDIYDEAWVQEQLRDKHNIEIKCYQLNRFPTNTDDFETYLIRHSSGQLELFPTI